MSMGGYYSIIFLLLFVYPFLAQEKTKIYFIHGQGSDCRIFDSLVISDAYEKKYINYGTPARRTSMRDVAREISMEIDTTGKFILVGVSLGGMICAEPKEILRPTGQSLFPEQKTGTNYLSDTGFRSTSHFTRCCLVIS